MNVYNVQKKQPFKIIAIVSETRLFMATTAHTWRSWSNEKATDSE